MRRDLGLVEQDRLVRVDPAGDEGRNHFKRRRAQFLRVMRQTERVQVGEEDQARSATGERFVLQLHVIDDRAKVIAKMRLAGGLNAGNDVHGFR